MKKNLFLSLILIFLLVGCQTASEDLPQPTNTAQPPATAQPTNTAQPINTSTPFAGGECDSGTERIDMDVSYSNHISGGHYPEGCYVYCLWVPAGNSLKIGISDFSIDCDIYVDMDLSVLEYSDHGAWESNDFGTGDEEVTISNPEGRYYIQVCTYDTDESLESDFILYSIFTP